MSLFALLAIGAFGLGCIWGSFLNALIFRFNTGRGLLRGMSGRSKCMRCGHTLGSADLVPLFSYIFLGGSCRYCGSGISLQYPLVEFVAGALSVGVYSLFFASPLWYAFWLLVWLTTLFIVVYDARHMIIPWSSSLFLLALAIIYLAMGPLDLWSVAAGPLLALPLFLLSLVSGGRWMGWADSLFELSLGALLGLSMGATALMLAVWSGAAVGIVLLAFSKRATMHMKSEIPFAPFLALGAAIAFFLHVDFFSSFALLL